MLNLLFVAIFSLLVIVVVVTVQVAVVVLIAFYLRKEIISLYKMIISLFITIVTHLF